MENLETHPVQWKKRASDNNAICEHIDIWNSDIEVLTRKEDYYPKSAEGTRATTYFQSDFICCNSSGFNRYFDQIGNQFGKVHLFPFVILCSNDDDLTSSWQRIWLHIISSLQNCQFLILFSLLSLERFWLLILVIKKWRIILLHL